VNVSIPAADPEVSRLPAAQAPVVSLRGVTKRFPGVVASDTIDLDIHPGEVHVLLGENGAGKSTLISMLAGLVQPDEGEILLDGEPVSLSSPKDAINAGIGTVFQHSMLVPTLSVTENLLLGDRWWRRPDRASLATRVAAIVEPLGISLRLDAPAADLSLGEQQQVEIVRALLRDSRLLILDESTSMLSPSGIEELGALMRRLVSRGLAVVFISHKLNEAAAFGDRISILRLGRKVGSIGPERFRALEQDVLVAEIIEHMFDDQERGTDASVAKRLPVDLSGEPLLVVRDVSLSATDTSPALRKLDLDAWPGEIVGIAGIDGNGQKQLAELLAGQRALEGGSIHLAGQRLDGLNVGERCELGLRYLTDDRLGEGTLGEFPVSLNFFIKQIGSSPYWQHGFVRGSDIDAEARRLVKEFDVRTPSIRTPVGRLSGGNIQKVVLGRELAEGARLVVFNKPTYGLDVKNIRTIQRRMMDAAASGIGLIVISTELDELLLLCHRIAVMVDGAIVGTVSNTGESVRHDIGRLMAGVTS